MRNLNDRVDCNFVELHQERMETRTAYFRVPKDITVIDVDNYVKDLKPHEVDILLPEWDNEIEDDFEISKSDLDTVTRKSSYSLINDVTINDDKTKLILSNRYTRGVLGTGVLFRDLTKVK